jgi:2-furoyl-CoA dehydrogenase large subunit
VTYVGHPIPRVEDLRLLRGRGRFVADLTPVGNIQHVAFVRSPHAHARIEGVGVKSARQAPGVLAVITADEAAELLQPFSVGVRSAPLYWPLAKGVTRYVGEVVAIVVATDRYLAEDAAELVQVDYEPLDPVLDLEAAPAVSARSFRYGDPEGQLASAAHRVGATFRFPRYSSTPIECYAIVADWDPAEEAVTVWSNFHGPFVMQPLVARSLGLPGNRLRLICPPDIGGSFGIKSGVYAYIPLVALASRVVGVPVRWTADRWEDLVASQAGTDRVTRGELALDGEGRMTALRLEILDDVGAYLRPPEPATLYRCFGNMTGAYQIRDVGVEAKAVLTNRPPTGLNRGFGGQQLYFTLERLVDMAAHRIGVDPLELRRRNLISPEELPYRTPLGGVYDSGDLPRLLEAARGVGGYERLRCESRGAWPASARHSLSIPPAPTSGTSRWRARRRSERRVRANRVARKARR